MVSHMIVASCSLNQWALDWEGNLTRIKASIQEAKAQEDDIYTNSWHMLLEILEDDVSHGILLDIGMPVKHGKQRLNW
ncbi:glutamine-dependent NAD(+) synthetase [Didymella sp. IMI 355093]|nr:glutamine-dependent NAD(+) synthetase [Didymella sp. IMI 355093]